MTINKKKPCNEHESNSLTLEESKSAQKDKYDERFNNDSIEKINEIDTSKWNSNDVQEDDSIEKMIYIGRFKDSVESAYSNVRIFVDPQDFVYYLVDHYDKSKEVKVYDENMKQFINSRKSIFFSICQSVEYIDYDELLRFIKIKEEEEDSNRFYKEWSKQESSPLSNKEVQFEQDISLSENT